MAWIFSVQRAIGFARNALRGDSWMVRLEHLYKLYFYPQAQYEHNNWMRSVWTSCWETWAVDKKKKRFLEEADIFHEIWEVRMKPTVESRVTFAKNLLSVINSISKYSPPILPVDEDVIKDFCAFCELYHEWLAGDLHQKGNVTQRECADKLGYLLVGCLYWKRHR